MAELAVKNLEGEQVDTITVSDAVFGVPVNVPLMHQAVTRILADQRLGTHKAKTRSEVAGSTAKVWRQKGTGRARHGSRKAPIWRGGGVAFPPQPRSYEVRIPKKMRRQATRSALTSQLAVGALTVVSTLQPEEVKTKAMVAALKNLGVSGKILLVDERISPETSRAARNIPQVDTKPASTLNIVDVLNHEALVLSIDGIRHIERLLTDANA